MSTQVCVTTEFDVHSLIGFPRRRVCSRDSVHIVYYGRALGRKERKGNGIGQGAKLRGRGCQPETNHWLIPRELLSMYCTLELVSA